MREYKDRVREYFSHKKGDGLILSPTNWMVVEKWEKMGIPLHVVIQGIDKTFENLCSSGLQQKRVNHLGYCEPEILNLWRVYQKKNYAGSSQTGSVAYACTDTQAAYLTQQTQAGSEKNPADKDSAQEQKKIREYVDRKISLFILRLTQLTEKSKKNKSTLEKDNGSLEKGNLEKDKSAQQPVDNSPACSEVIVDTQESPDDTMQDLLQRTIGAIRLEEELIQLRQEARTSNPIDIELIEKRLQKLDGQFVQSLFAGLCSDKRDALLSSAEKQTRRYKNQMEGAAYQETIQAYSIELLRRELGIHQMSLYQ